MSLPPKPVAVKKEKIKPEDPAESTAPRPWETKLVLVKKSDSSDEQAADTKVVPARSPHAAPWAFPDFVPAMPRDIETNQQQQLPPVPEPPADKVEAPVLPKGRREKKSPRVAAPRLWGENVPHMLSVKNYVAVDPSREVFGLIDQGLSDTGTRSLIMHLRRGQLPWEIFGAVKPGGVLPVIAKSGRGGTIPLHVRFTTPAMYYAPGRKMTSMTIGVDETDWQSLMAKAHRI